MTVKFPECKRKFNNIRLSIYKLLSEYILVYIYAILHNTHKLQIYLKVFPKHQTIDGFMNCIDVFKATYLKINQYMCRCITIKFYAYV